MSIPDNRVTILRLNLFLVFFEGVVAVWMLVKSPSEIQSVVLVNYSLPRLILLSIVFTLLLVMAVLFFRSFRVDWLEQGSGKFIDLAINRSSTFWSLLVSGGMMFFLVFASGHVLGSFAPYRERLYPILIWFALISLQAIAGLIFIRGMGSGLFHLYRESLYSSGVILGLFMFLIVFISLTKTGLSPDPIYWQGPGVPILLYQVIIALVPGLLFQLVLIRFDGVGRTRIELVVCIGLWLLAGILWWNQPARTSYNSLAPDYPNFQSYPFGDAILYDTVAHQFLTGTSMPNDFWVKPLYTLFLAFLHGFSGENYLLLILLQIVILAVIPVLVYLLVSLMGNRPAGVVAGLLVIFRERNAIVLSNVIQVSHLKLLLSDVFSMGLVVLLLWILLRWSQKPGERRHTLLIVGGVLSLLILTRGHPILLFPLIAGILLLVKFPTRGQRWQGMVYFTLGTALALIPWIWRIYETSGRFAIQSPVSPYSANLAGLYSFTPDLADPEAFTTTITSQTLEQFDSQRKQIVDFMIQHPDEVFRFVSAHYFHNVIYSYIYLPQSFRIESLRSYVATEPFWGLWKGALSAQGWILLCLNILFISLGIGSAWRKHGFPALVPLLIGMGYNASVSVGRISGWRFILPADWITLIYLSIGLIQGAYMIGYILNRVVRDVSVRDYKDPLIGKSSTCWVGTVGFAVLFLSIGSTVTYGNQLFSGRYPAKSVQRVADEYLTITQSIGRSFSEKELTDFIQNGHGKAVYGQAIYPYFLKENSGPINHYWPAYKPRPYNRVVFYLVSSESLNVVLPVPSPDFIFPDGADVIVLGCSDENGDMDAVSVLIMGDSPTPYTRDPLPPLICPLP